ncbi:MAG: NUDIX domain-containing protein [Desulfobacteraceae bacterium]|nr:MAG: NUDIX domain-containing protein [Desulfobacteraceae bacterium]
MKRKGSSILFVNDHRQVLLFLRDDKPDIPFPNMWDVPGGHVERDETPEQCIVREMKEEMGIGLKGFFLFCVREFEDRIEYTYWKKENLRLEEIRLTEGQDLRWFSKEQAAGTKLALGFNEIVADFYEKAPFLARQPGTTTF